jgi:decaprenylphospho-beta-D-ribofuranose 2-oxidase
MTLLSGQPTMMDKHGKHDEVHTALPKAQVLSIAGWGNLPVETCAVYAPTRLRDVAELLKWGSEEHYITRGLGRSYGDAALNSGSGVIATTHLNKMIALDRAAGVIECEAGVSLAEMIEVIVPRGFFLPVTPGTRFVTLGGAIAADVHGKNHHIDGSIAAFIESIDLQTAGGERLTCSPTENSDVFFATLGGMGLTGAILSARMRLRRVESAYLDVTYERLKNLTETLDRFNETDATAPYSVAWIDCLATGESLGRSVLMRGEHAQVNQLPGHLQRDRFKLAPREPKLSMPIRLPGFALNQFTVSAFNSLYYRMQKSRHAIVHYEPFFYPLDKIAHWNRMYGKRGFIQYQCVLPMETSRQGLPELLQTLATSRQPSFLAVLKSFGPESGGLMSFPKPGHTLALDIPNSGNGEKLRTLVTALDEIVLRYSGRVYLAKDAMLTPFAVQDMYPRLDKFREICNRLDPEGRLSSSLSRRLQLRGDA